MKLDRNLPGNTKGKYVLINCRKMGNDAPPTVVRSTTTGEKKFYLIPVDAVDFGAPGAIDEFFVIRLRDRHAFAALEAYSESIRPIDPEFAEEVFELAKRSGRFSPFCKDPD